MHQLDLYSDSKSPHFSEARQQLHRAWRKHAVRQFIVYIKHDDSLMPNCIIQAGIVELVLRLDISTCLKEIFHSIHLGIDMLRLFLRPVSTSGPVLVRRPHVMEFGRKSRASSPQNLSVSSTNQTGEKQIRTLQRIPGKLSS